DHSLSLTWGNQINANKNNPNKKLGYILSLTYNRDYKYWNDVTYGEHQRYKDAEKNELRYATVQRGEVSENTALVGVLGGIAYKTLRSKYRLSALRIQSGISRAGIFHIDND